MRFKYLLFSVVCILLLTACGNDSSKEVDDSTSLNESSQQNSRTVPQDKEDSETTTDQQQEKINSDKEVVEETPDNSGSQDKQQSSEPASADTKTKTVANSAESKQEGTAVQEAQQAEEAESDSTTGFSVVNGEVEAAKNVPASEEAAILAAFNEYINAFNAQDINRYKKVLAQNPEGFDLAEDVEGAKKIFNSFDIYRDASNITITEYTGNRAYVYADMVIDVKQDNSESHDEGKQLTQFVKESTGWKVTSLQAIGSAAKD